MSEVASQTLDFVGRELNVTLAEARTALENYVEQPDNVSLLERCAQELHQVQGVLRVLEIYGAALLAEEMEQVAEYLLATVAERKSQAESLDALMRAMVQLPSYLERVLAGGRDLALVLLPLLNDLRAVRGSALLSEGTLLLLNLKSDKQAQPIAAAPGEPPLSVEQWARRLRARFQVGLIGWIRGERVEQNLDVLAAVAQKLEQIATRQPLFQLWWVIGAVIEALQENGLEGGVSVKRLLGLGDREIRRLYEQGEARYAQSPAVELLNNLLYYVGRAESSGPRVTAVRASFRLSELLPVDESIEQERENLSAPSVKLMQTVAAAIREDLSKVKDVLDIFVRRGAGQPKELASQVEMLRKIGDTLGVLGLGELRGQVQTQTERLEHIVNGSQQPDEASLVEIAATLIGVEDRLDSQLVGLIRPKSMTVSEEDADNEFQQVQSAVLRECILNLARIKEAITQSVGGTLDAAGLDSWPELMRGLKAGLLMLGKARAVEVVDGITNQLKRVMQPGAHSLPPGFLDRLADAIVSVEYYMETLQAGRSDPWYMLDNAQACVQALESQEEAPLPGIPSVEAGVYSKTVQITPAGGPAEADPGVTLVGIGTPMVSATRPITAPLAQSADPELVKLFIEEAHEELAKIRKFFPAWDQNPMERDSLVTVRRSFHTLKGSGRMVGARELGEFAWSVENLLNRILDNTLSRSPQIVEVLRDAVAALPELIEQLDTGRAVRADTAGISGRAQALATGKPATTGAPTAATAAPTAATAAPATDVASAAPAAPPPATQTPSVSTGVAASSAPVADATVSAPTAPGKGEPSFVLNGLPHEEQATHPALHVEGIVAPARGSQRAERVQDGGAEVRQPVEPHDVDAQSVEPQGVGSQDVGSQDVEPRAAEAHAGAERRPEEWSGTPAQAASVGEAAVGAAEAAGIVEHPWAPEEPHVLEQPEGAGRPLLDFTGDEVSVREEGENAQSGKDEVLRDIYTRETGTHVATVRAYLERERTRPEPHTIPEDVYRACHTLSGSSKMAQVRHGIRLAEPLDHWLRRLFNSGLGLQDTELQLLSDCMDAMDSVATHLDETSGYFHHHAALKQQIEQAENDLDGRIADARAQVAQAAPAAPSESADDGALDYDPEVASIFTEEALELIEFSEQALSEWRAGPESAECRSALKRPLHTLKGGARMAGILAMGNLSHELETLVMQVDNGSVSADAEMFDVIQASLDELARMREAVANGRRVAPARAMIARIQSVSKAGGTGARPLVVPQDETVPSRSDAASAGAEFIARSPPSAGSPSIAGAPNTAGAPSTVAPPSTEAAAQAMQGELGAADETLIARPPLASEESVASDLASGSVAAELAASHAGAEIPSEPSLHSEAAPLETLTPAEAANDQEPYAFVPLGCHPDEAAGYAALLDQAEGAKSSAETPSSEMSSVEMSRAETSSAETSYGQTSYAGTSRTDRSQPADFAATSPGTAAKAVSVTIGRIETRVQEDGLLAPAAVPPGREPVAPAERQEMARVDADLLDQLLNVAGEASIARSRLEQQLGSIDFNLGELSRTVTRLKEQLRNLEIETEAQILHRHEDEGTHRGDFDPLELDRYSSIQQFSRALAETANDVGSIQQLLENLGKEAQNLLQQQARTITELQNGLMRTRMVPFQRHVQRLARIVRQAASDTGKRAELVVEGAAGELDRQVLERMLPPFEHMLRNAVVHGIEKPAERAAAGKPEAGRIVLELHREGAEVMVRLTDDGAGMNLEAIRQKGTALGLIPPGSTLSDEDAMQLILEPGFSTAGTITQQAGRGVGMDVVATEIKRLGGALHMETKAGQGTTFTIRLPFTLAISHALVVRTSDEYYALPLPTVEGVLRLSKAEVVAHLGRDAAVFDYGGQKYRFQHLATFVGLETSPLPEQDVTIPVVLVRAGEHSTGLVADELVGSREIVVKSVGPQISGIRGISGATILGDGRIVIILDIGALVRAEWRGRGQTPLIAPKEKTDKRIFAMVVDDSITVRRVTQRLLERNSMRVLTARDGMDAVTLLQDHVPDIILLDIEMPRMDGYEVAAHVRNDPRLKDVPIIMITSRVGEKHRARAIELGVDDYLGKPYQEAQLLDAIAPLVERRKGAQASSGTFARLGDSRV